MDTYQKHIMRKGFFLSACFLLISLFSCKDEGDLNPNFVNGNVNSKFTSDVRITAQVRSVDSILTDGVATGLVGLYRDSVFGLSRASFYVQPLLNSNFQVFYENNETFQTDSVVITFPYTSVFGDSTLTTIEVYRLDEKLESSTVYYSNDSVSVLPAILGTKTFLPDIANNVRVVRPNLAGVLDTLVLAPQLRIKLDNSLGDEILSKSGQTEVENNTNFTDFLKGFRIQTSNGLQANNNNEISILSLALTNIQSKLSVYYTVTDNNNVSTKKVVDFPITSNSVRFNSYEHNFSGSVVGGLIDDAKNDSDYLYVSGMSGVQTEIQFPNLAERFKDSAMVVNRAEIVFPLSAGSYARTGFAEQLILASKNENGQLQFLDDFFEGESYFGGRYESSRNAYVFNINRYVQSILNGTNTSKALVVLVEGSATTPSRAVLFGPAQSNEKIKLNLYYSNTLD